MVALVRHGLYGKALKNVLMFSDFLAPVSRYFGIRLFDVSRLERNNRRSRAKGRDIFKQSPRVVVD